MSARTRAFLNDHEPKLMQEIKQWIEVRVEADALDPGQTTIPQDNVLGNYLKQKV